MTRIPRIVTKGIDVGPLNPRLVFSGQTFCAGAKSKTSSMNGNRYRIEYGPAALDDLDDL
jgi:hypothetical protein